MLCAPAPFGGLETVVAALASGLATAGHEVRVGLVVQGCGETGLGSELAAAGVAVHELIVAPRDYRGERRQVEALLRDTGAMVLHTHGYRCDVTDAPVARRLGIPVVATVHGFIGGGWRNRLYEWADARALRRFDAAVAVSRPLARRLEQAGVPASRICCIPNALPEREVLPREVARRELGLEPEAFVVGWVGRLSREKGPDLLVRALARTAGVRGVLLGTGPDVEATRRLARDLGVEARVLLPGFRPGAGALLRAFDALVVSSRTEGAPMIVLEAMRAGVPLVATRVGGIPDMLSGDEALLVAPESPEALAAAIDAVRGDPGGAARRGRLARLRLTREFAPGPWVERYVRVYRAILEGRPCPA